MFGDLHSICNISKSYSLEGEDRIALSLLRDIVKTHDSLFYVDIGCNHPETGNNTKLFYDLGKRGLCVDPLPAMEQAYKRKRPADLFFSGAVGTECLVDFYIFEDDTASSADPDTVSRYKDKFRLKKSVTVMQKQLDSILSNFGYTKPVDIPLLSVDVEGSDLEVVRQVLEQSIHTYHVLIIEDKLVNIDPSFPNNISAINALAHRAGYGMISKTPLNSVYILRNSPIFSWIPLSMRYMTT